MRTLLCVWRQPHKKKTPRRTSGREPRKSILSEVLKGAGKAPGCPATYCGVGVGAEYGVLPDDAIQLERGQPGHEDHGG